MSISRTARVGLANHLFRLLMLPGASLQALTWVLCGLWLADLGVMRGRALRLLSWLGVAGAVFLAAYALYLGTPGQPYDWFREYGIPVYFGGTYLCMVITASHVRTLARAGGTALPVGLARLLMLLAAFTTGTGILQIFLRPFLTERHVRVSLSNTLEWYAALAFTLFFFALAGSWRHTRFTVRRSDVAPAIVAGLAGRPEGGRPRSWPRRRPASPGTGPGGGPGDAGGRLPLSER
jgi:hypothetical protein